ncbi:hypothetical protein BAE44_0025780 [Dichanthelium oligosanthes]|uniref:Transcription repressor n=1 Tax=Dichanthelium oligosanthes TaxID=888268 RepID=A0A1E5UK10_9POAL|nr:hypothetical protein BAE44_0025780 [Dichanthelium oligosanthes]
MRGSKQGKGRAFSFSPLSWLAKVTGKEKPCASAAKHAPASSSTCKDGAAAAPPFPSCLPRRTSPSPVTVAPGRACSPPRRSPPDVAPRRLSVGNDNADAVAVRRRCQQRRRRHCSLGGDGELRPLGRLIPFSLAGSPASGGAGAAAPSDTMDGPGAASAWARHRRRRSGRRLSVSGGRRSSSSFSGRMPPLRVRVRSPRRATGLVAESLAVVRRTRDPQRAFRESMVEMIAGTGGGAEELERLLACYLSLNADEHHDCIVKVFRQVWFEHLSLLPRPDAGAGGGRRRPPARRRC